MLVHLPFLRERTRKRINPLLGGHLPPHVNLVPTTTHKRVAARKPEGVEEAA